MKQTILNKEKSVFKKELTRAKTIAIGTAVLTLMLNILFCLLRNEENHYLMLGLNIASDILCLWFLIAYISFSLSPRSKLLKIFEKEHTLFSGEIASVSDETVRIQGFDCFKIILIGERERTLFLPDASDISLTVGEKVALSAVSGIITEVDR